MSMPRPRGPVRIHLRGELRLEVDGRRVEGSLPGRLGRALLAYLVLHRHRQMTRDELVHALWPSRAGSSSRLCISPPAPGVNGMAGSPALRGS